MNTPVVTLAIALIIYSSAPMARYIQGDPVGILPVAPAPALSVPTMTRAITAFDVLLLQGLNQPYGYVRGNPLYSTDPRGLEATLVTTYDYGFGSHSALFVNTPGQRPFLYDPAGSYQPRGEPRGTGGFFEGSQANLQNYIRYQESLGSTVELVKILTTPSQEHAIKERAMDIGDPRGFSCASAVSQALGGVCQIPGAFFPGNLRRQFQGALCRP